jgi:transcriptional regulator with XRE-family HTH domain
VVVIVILTSAYALTRGEEEAGICRHARILSASALVSRKIPTLAGLAVKTGVAADFGKLLQQYIDDAKSSQREVARAAKLPQATIRQSIAGIRPPPLAKLLAIADALKLEAARRDALVDAGLRASGLDEIADLLKRAREEVTELNARLDRIEEAMRRRAAETKKRNDH